MTSDKTTNIEELKKEVSKFVKERNWDRFQNLRSLAISLSLESNEFLDHFQWLSDSEVANLEKDKVLHPELIEELCDILSYILITANKLDIDITSEFLKKLEKNRKKYPAAEFSKDLSREDDNKKYQKLRKDWKS
jgi:dCTP diphosphatase